MTTTGKKWRRPENWQEDVGGNVTDKAAKKRHNHFWCENTKWIPWYTNTTLDIKLCVARNSVVFHVHHNTFLESCLKILRQSWMQTHQHNRNKLVEEHFTTQQFNTRSLFNASHFVSLASPIPPAQGSVLQSHSHVIILESEKGTSRKKNMRGKPQEK